MQKNRNLDAKCICLLLPCNIKWPSLPELLHLLLQCPLEVRRGVQTNCVTVVSPFWLCGLLVFLANYWPFHLAKFVGSSCSRRKSIKNSHFTPWAFQSSYFVVVLCFSFLWLCVETVSCWMYSYHSMHACTYTNTHILGTNTHTHTCSQSYCCLCSSVVVWRTCQLWCKFWCGKLYFICCIYEEERVCGIMCCVVTLKHFVGTCVYGMWCGM